MKLCKIYSQAYLTNHKYAKDMGFEAGAQWMQSELTRWRDVNEELPGKGERVLVMSKHCGIQIAYLDTHGEWLLHQGTSIGEATHWLPIPEFVNNNHSEQVLEKIIPEPIKE